MEYLNSQSQVVLWIDADGVLRINTTAAQGAVQQDRIALRVRLAYPVAPVVVTQALIPPWTA